jgi:hypothetical protein
MCPPGSAVQKLKTYGSLSSRPWETRAEKLRIELTLPHISMGFARLIRGIQLLENNALFTFSFQTVKQIFLGNITKGQGNQDNGSVSKKPRSNIALRVFIAITVS